MRTNKAWRKTYFKYVNSYNRINRELISKYGVGMAHRKLDYWSWRDVYGGLERVRLAEVAEGSRGKSLNINRDILAHQKFGMSYDQGRWLLRAKRKLLKDKLKILKRNSLEAKEVRKQIKELSLDKMRLGLISTDDIEAAMTGMNEDLKFDGVNSRDRSKKIGEQFFGSA